MGSSSNEEIDKKVSNLNKTIPRIFHFVMGNSSDQKCEDDLNDSQKANEYKELSYKLFQFRTYKLKCSNGDFGCPFCDHKVEHQQCQYVHLLLHAIRVGESSESLKQRAKHLAMAKYLVIDLAHDVKAEADRLSWSEEGKRLKRPRLDEDSSKGEMDAADKVRQLERELNEKTDEMNDLITKERQSNDELQGARSELIKGWNDILRGNHDNIGIKYIGEIDSKAFITEMEKRCFSTKYAEIKGAGLCSLWQENLKDPQWYPYQIIEDDKGKPQRLLKEDDESLQGLKKEWGQEVHDAVVTAMNELHEYNPSECYMVPELWNFNENRKAKLDEVISYILKAVKDVFKTGSTSEFNNSRVEEHSQKGSCLGKQRDTNVSRTNDSDIYEFKENAYKLFKSCTWKVRRPSGQLSCPLCSVEGDKEYNYDYLLRHALMVAEDSSESAEQRGNHFALAKYLVIDLQDEAEPAPQIVKERRELDTSQEDIERKRQRLDEEKRKEKALKNLLKENEDLKRSYQNLLAREQKSNAELKGVRKQLMKGLDDWQSGNQSGIGIKQMGEIDVDVFKRVCSKRFRPTESETGAEVLCSLWQDLLENPEWHPFRMVEDDKGNLEVVVEEDESLRRLKHNWGDEIYSAVVTALKDLCEYNPRRRRIFSEIWNFKDNRKAKLEEVISYVFAQSNENNKKMC